MNFGDNWKECLAWYRAERPCTRRVQNQHVCEPTFRTLANPVVSQDYAKYHGLTQFSVYQGHFSCAFRDFEREILPMVRAEGMGIAPWGALSRDMLKKPEDFDDPNREGGKTAKQSDKHARIAAKLDEIAQRKGTIITSVALAYVMHKAPHCFPIVGGRKVAHLEGNIAALGLSLDDAEIKEIEDAEPFDVDFPLSFLLGDNYHTNFASNDIPMLNTNWRLETVPKVQPIEPRQGENKFAAKGE